MTSSNVTANFDNTDELPIPVTVTVAVSSAIALPRPISSVADIADSGRISFGAGYRLASK